MRISHIAALADVVLGDAEALARAYHEIVVARLGDFETDDARRRCAIAVHAVGMATDPVAFRAAYARIAGGPIPDGAPMPTLPLPQPVQVASGDAGEGHAPQTMPVCPDCGSELIVRDASARWDKLAQRWALADVLDSDFCDACNADGNDLVRWVAISGNAAGPVESIRNAAA